MASMEGGSGGQEGVKKKRDEGLVGESNGGEVLQSYGLTFTCFMSFRVYICTYLILTIRFH